MMNKTELFQTIRKQAQKVFPSMAKTNQKDKNNSTSSVGFVVEGQAQERQLWDTDYQDLHQLFRHQFPSVTKQLLGRRYNTVNKVSRLVLPNGMDQAADELLELLDDFASQWASTASVLSATGCKQINQLANNAARSQRTGFALKEVNKAIAALQGAVSGMTGLFGAAVDLPASVIFSLKTIYEIGHSYGFELDRVEDQKAVYFALSQMDLGLIAEKQTLFLVLRGFKNIVATGDISQIQSFLNSNYSVEQFSNYLVDENGQYKWSALNILDKVKVLRFATPIVGGAVGALYSVKLIEEVAFKADGFFAQARLYYKENPESSLSILDAYHSQQQIVATQANLLQNASPLLADIAVTAVLDTQETQAHAIAALAQNDTIVAVEVQDKPTDKPLASDTADVENKIHQGIEQLAAENIEVTESVSEQPATVLKTTKSEQSTIASESEEDLTKDLVKLVQVHTEKTKKIVEKPTVEAKKDEAPIVAEVEVKPATKTTKGRKPAATTRKTSTSRTRKKPTDQNDSGV